MATDNNGQQTDASGSENKGENNGNKAETGNKEGEVNEPEKLVDKFFNIDDETFLDRIRRAEWVLPELEKKTEQGHSLLKQKGFNIVSLSRGYPVDLLNETINNFKKRQEADEEYVIIAINDHKWQFESNLIHQNELLALQFQKIKDIKDQRPSLRKGKDILTEKKEKIKADLEDISMQIADSKKDLLNHWIDEVRTKINNLFSLNEEVMRKKREMAETSFNHNTSQNKIIADELIIARNKLKDQQVTIDSHINVLNTEGVNKNSAKVLIIFGYIASLAAGWLFSIFALKAMFGSEDVIFYLFNGLQEMAHNMPGNGFSRIFQLAGVLGIITAASLICRSIMVHVKRRQTAKANRLENEEYNFSLQPGNNDLQYVGKIKSANWILFWLKLLPFLMVVGTLIIFLSFYNSYKSHTEELDVSLLGLMLGNAITIGLAGIVYLYITKVIEPRLFQRSQQNKKRRGLHSWELYAVVGFFVVSVAYVFYESNGVKFNSGPKATPGFLVANKYLLMSLALFLSVAFLGAFSLGYGIRYKSMADLSESIEGRIFEYNGIIDRYTGSFRVYPNRDLNGKADDLMDRLMEQIRKRNDRIFKNNETTIPRWFGTRAGKQEKVQTGKWIMDIIKWIFGLLEEIFMPSDKEKGKNGAFGFAFHERKEEPWEKEFFADLYEKKEVYLKNIEEIDEEIETLEKRIEDLENRYVSPLSAIYNSIDLINIEIHALRKRIDKAIQAREEAIAIIKGKYQAAEEQLLSGYNLGLWYKQYELGPQINDAVFTTNGHGDPNILYQ